MPKSTHSRKPLVPHRSLPYPRKDQSKLILWPSRVVIHPQHLRRGGFRRLDLLTSNGCLKCFRPTRKPWRSIQRKGQDGKAWSHSTKSSSRRRTSRTSKAEGGSPPTCATPTGRCSTLRRRPTSSKLCPKNWSTWRCPRWKTSTRSSTFWFPGFRSWRVWTTQLGPEEPSLSWSVSWTLSRLENWPRSTITLWKAVSPR